jgi:hypothetical protein
MNDESTVLDQTDERIITHSVSDEALEAAAGTEMGGLPCHLGFTSFLLTPDVAADPRRR